MLLSGIESGIEQCWFFKDEGLGDLTLFFFFSLYGESNYTLTPGRLAALGKTAHWAHNSAV